MSVTDIHRSVQTEALVGTASTKRSSAGVSTMQCLVLSTSQARRRMLGNATTDAGWDALVCADVGNGWSSVQREKFELAVVDLQEVTEQTLDGLKQLCEELSSMSGVLLVICGNEGDAMEEIWARQLGAWLYLPGVSMSNQEDVAQLCIQARPIAEKLSGADMQRV